MTQPSTSPQSQKSSKPIFELIADPKATQTLPSLGTIVNELSQIMARSHTPLQEISSLISRDQSMSVRILRIANSAYFAPSQPILTVEEALLYLGLNQVRSSILTARCIEQTCDIPEDLLSWKQFWTHSVAVGCVSRILAFQLLSPIHNVETYYMMGLLHDIGKLALAYLSPEDFQWTLQQAHDQSTSMSGIEFQLLGIDHANLGGWYLQQQGLPIPIQESVRYHHSWTPDENPGVHPCVVSLANLITHQLSMGRSGSEYEIPIPIYSTPQWEFYSSQCGCAPDSPALVSSILSKLETVPLLVDQLTK